MTRRRCATGALLLAVALTGCTSDSDPDATPTTTPVVSTPSTSAPTSATTEPTPSPTPTPEPVALTPEQTVRAWVEAFNAGSSTGQLGPLRNLSTGSCLQCNQLIDGIAATYERGGSIDSAGWRIARMKKQPDFGRSGQLAAFVKSSAGTIISEAGAAPKQEAADDFLLNWRVQRVQGTWLVAELTFLS